MNKFIKKPSSRNVYSMLSAFFLLALALTSCSNKTTQPEESLADNSKVTFEVAKNYFFKNNQQIPENPKITTEEMFDSLFGMATTMGENGKPTSIDFSKQFVLAVVLPVTDIDTEIRPLEIEEKNDSLFYSYEVKSGQKQSFSIQPASVIIVDKKHVNKEVVMIAK